MLKVVFPQAFNFNAPTARLMDVHARGVDAAWMQKRAAVLTAELKSVRPEKGHSFIHLITMGAQEYYGANRNGDGFNEKTAKWELPAPKKGTPKIITLDGGLTQNHRTFLKYAHVFKDHVNKDPDLRSGDVHAEAYNPDMHRGELIIKVQNDKWEPELEKLASGDDIAFSMSCKVPYDICFAAGTPIRTIGGWKPIEQIGNGEQVMTHVGRWQQVRQLMVTSGERRALSINVVGYPDALTATDNHPFFAVCADSAMANQRRYRRKQLGGTDTVVGVVGYAEPTFVPADQLTTDGYCLFPAPTGNARPTVDPWLAGLYLADGSIFGQRHGRKKNKGVWRPTGVRWSLGIDKLEIVKYLRSRLAELRGADVLRVYPDGKRDNSLVAIVHDQELAHELLRLFGRCEHKHVAAEVLEWEPGALLALLGGWLDGDGSQDAKKGSVRGCSVLDGIARGMWEASVRAGVPAAWHRDSLDGNSWAASAHANILHFQAAYTPRLAEHSIKLASMARRPRTCSFYITHGGVRYLALPISAVSETSVAETYNLSVDVDESYVAAFAAVHNCSICGNRAPSRKEYCDHLTNEMNRVKEAGHQVFAINDRPLFFDISGVFRPADRIAYGLRKVASTGVTPEEFIPSAQLAEMWGISAPRSVLLDTSPRYVQEKLAAMERMAAMEKQIEATGRLLSPELSAGVAEGGLDDDAASKMRSVDWNELMGSLSQAKVCLPVRDFFRLVLGDKYDSVAGEMDSVQSLLPGIFSRMLDGGDEVEDVTGMKTYDPAAGLVPKSVRDIVESLKPGMSLEEGPARRRVSVTIIRGGSPDGDLRKVSHDLKPSKAASYLAKQYAAYQLAFVRAAEGADDGLVTGLAVLGNYAA